MKGLQTQVREILTENVASRDCDKTLFSAVVRAKGLEPSNVNLVQYIAYVDKRILPNYDSITRVRRLLQMREPQLRGILWDSRHGLKQDKAKKDLGYGSTPY